jgi:hypothetical protein
MQTSSMVRSVVVYTLVALVLGAAIFGGLLVTKSRNSTVANAPQPVATQPKTDTNKQPAQQTPPAAKPDASAKPTPAAPAPTPKPNPVAAVTPPKTSSTQSAKPSTPVSVPATGTDDTVVAVMALMGLVFAGFMYAQSRRRLLTLR